MVATSMTIDEAILTLESVRRVYAHIRRNGDEWQAVEMAIAALRAQQEAEKNGPLTLKDIVDLQRRYRELVDTKRLTKKAMCELAMPFRDKYGFKDSTALKIVRAELTLEEIEKLISSCRHPTGKGAKEALQL